MGLKRLEGDEAVYYNDKVGLEGMVLTSVNDLDFEGT